MNREALKDLLDYTDFTWALYERVVGALADGALMKAIDGSGWPSLFNALKHLVAGHDGWLNDTYRVGPVLVEDPDSITSWEQLLDIRTKLREASRRLLNDTPDAMLWQRTTKAWEAGGESLYMSIGEMLWHVLLHERGHHGDVSTLLHQLGAQAPANDYAVYLWFKERRA